MLSLGAKAPRRRLKGCVALVLVVALVQFRAYTLLRLADGASGSGRIEGLRKAWLPRQLQPDDDVSIDSAEGEHWRRDNLRLSALLAAAQAAVLREPEALEVSDGDGGGFDDGEPAADEKAADGSGEDGESADEAHMSGMDAMVRSLEQDSSADAAHSHDDSASASSSSSSSESAEAVALSITLVSQTSEERVWMIEHTCERWPGALAVAVHVRGNPNKVMHMHQRVEKFGSCSTAGEVRLSLEVLHGRREDSYPINKLRNLAISRVTSTHMLLLDVDLWPSSELYNVLMYGLSRELPVDSSGESGHAFTLSEAKLAIVAPAFELSASAFSHLEPSALAAKVPRTFASLKDCHAKGNCFIFKKSTNTHRSTDYDRWWQRTDASAYQVECFDSIRYEPYVVVPVSASAPPRAQGRPGVRCARQASACALPTPPREPLPPAWPARLRARLAGGPREHAALR